MTGERITVIEPNEAQRLLYEWEFEDEGYEVASYANLADALGSQEVSTCALVLVAAGDRALEAWQRLHKVNMAFSDAAVVVHTASYRLASENPSEPCNAFLLKQPDLSDLKQTIRSLLSDAGAAERASTLAE